MRKEQEQAARLIKDFGLMTNPASRFLDLNSELGELAKELLKAGNYGGKTITVTDGVKDELGDCLFSMLALCEALGLDGEEHFYHALEKYRRRLADTGRADSGR